MLAELVDAGAGAITVAGWLISYAAAGGVVVVALLLLLVLAKTNIPIENTWADNQYYSRSGILCSLA